MIPAQPVDKHCECKGAQIPAQPLETEGCEWRVVFTGPGAAVGEHVMHAEFEKSC